jgi:type III restriction enzyme
MSDAFFTHPILNSPYAAPGRHWELDPAGQPTLKIIESRRRAQFISPIPRPRRHGGQGEQTELVSASGQALGVPGLQQYDHTELINSMRVQVDAWRRLPDPDAWGVTPETARLLQHWRHHAFTDVRPFFCQVEAVETLVWLTEVAPDTKAGGRFLEHLANANREANPDLLRLALKLATGAGKTTVMAMLIAWQTINSVRRPRSSRFTRGFLVVAPGLTIKDRLRVLQPNDPDSYYQSRELVPADLLGELHQARIVITNYHAFKLRERVELSKGGRQLLQGRTGEDLNTLETEGQMLQRVMPELMAMKNILAINDEAHHCYREKPDPEGDDEQLKGDERKEAERNKEAARLWISGLEAVNRQLGLSRVVDLSATPFFLAGSGYAEGTLFPWTMSDFSLMDAIESGIVKLPRVPVAENIPSDEMPMFRNLWENIRADMPKKGRGKASDLDPLALPTKLQTALEALYGHYEKTFEGWRAAGVTVPPCFIIVCNNTSTSKLVYDFISGFQVPKFTQGRLPLFRNFDDNGNPLSRPNTLLIDSEQLESGEKLDDTFRSMAGDELERFRREIVERTGDQQQADHISDQDLLREVMNTVGKPGRLGGGIRCVVSVSMLTEGWDANTVTHVLGVRAFGTQLLCEQVIGRALRRQSYEVNAEGLFGVEYADVLGIPFDFTAKPVIAPPQPPREVIQVKAMRPERDALEIRFPRVEGYRSELPEERLTAVFNEDSVLELTPDLVGPTITQNAGIIGQPVNLTLAHTKDKRLSSLVFSLTQRLLYTKWRDVGGEPKLHLFGQLKAITRQWLETCLVCKGDTYPALLEIQALADLACERITAGITRALAGKAPIKAILDAYNPTGSTAHVNFNTTRTERWTTDARRCHVNYVILDSGWEAELCRVVEAHPRVRAYVKNHSLGFEVPYLVGATPHRYRPDFIVLVEDGHGEDDLLHLVVEVKGYRREDAKDKRATMETLWVPGVNQLGTYGRWAFAELGSVYEIESEFSAKIAASFHTMLAAIAPKTSTHTENGDRHAISEARMRAGLHLAVQLGGDPRWNEINSGIWQSIAQDPDHVLRLQVLGDISRRLSIAEPDVLAVVAILSAQSANFLRIRLVSRAPGRGEVPVPQFIAKMRAWRQKALPDPEWQSWASATDVEWVFVPEVRTT